MGPGPQGSATWGCFVFFSRSWVESNNWFNGSNSQNSSHVLMSFFLDSVQCDTATMAQRAKGVLDFEGESSLGVRTIDYLRCCLKSFGH